MKLIDVFKAISESPPVKDGDEDKPSKAMEAASAAMDRAIAERRKAAGDRRQDTQSGPPQGMPERRSGMDRRGDLNDRRLNEADRRQAESALLNDGIAERRNGQDRRSASQPAFGKRNPTS